MPSWFNSFSFSVNERIFIANYYISLAKYLVHLDVRAVLTITLPEDGSNILCCPNFDIHYSITVYPKQ